MARTSRWAITAALTLSPTLLLAPAAQAAGTPDLEPQFSAGKPAADGTALWTLDLDGTMGPTSTGDAVLLWDLSAYTDDGDWTSLGYHDDGAECAGGEVRQAGAGFTSESDPSFEHLPSDTEAVELYVTWCGEDGQQRDTYAEFTRTEMADGSVSFERTVLEHTDVPEDGEELPEEDFSYADFLREMAPEIGSEWLWLADLPQPPAGVDEFDEQSWDTWVDGLVVQGVVPSDRAWFVKMSEDLPQGWQWLDELDESTEEWSASEIDAYLDEKVAHGELAADDRLAAEQLLTWLVEGPWGGDGVPEDMPAVPGAPDSDEGSSTAPEDPRGPEAPAEDTLPAEGEDGAQEGPAVDTGWSADAPLPWLALLGGAGLFAIGAVATALVGDNGRR